MASLLQYKERLDLLRAMELEARKEAHLAEHKDDVLNTVLETFKMSVAIMEGRTTASDHQTENNTVSVEKLPMDSDSTT